MHEDHHVEEIEYGCGRGREPY
jgi:DNA repair exonuclease SbcCD ATPase subunit